MICANIDNSIQVHIPRNKSSQSFVFQMKCQATSNTTHEVLMSKEIDYKSYKEICSGEPKKVNLGFNNDFVLMKVENKTLMPYPQSCGDFPYKPTENSKSNPCLFGSLATMTFTWEMFFKFFSIHNIEPNWLDCGFSWGNYDEELGGWTGCMGKV